MPTKTGRFPIGFRRFNTSWQLDAQSSIAWAAGNGFEAIDLNVATPADIHAVRTANLQLGSVDLIDMGQLLHTDTARRADLAAQNVAYIQSLATLGVKNFFTVLIPGDPTKKRPENYALAVESFAPIAQAAFDTQTRIVIEGWPGPAPRYPALCCTPESCRAFIKDTNPTSVGINYDPSHLIRLGVDHLRFLNEFIQNIHHVHAKDTQLYPDALYELGQFQDSIKTPPHRYGQHAWRYTIPSQGQANWYQIFSTLAANHYQGAVCIELEDENHNGTEEGEKSGLLQALEFLRGI